MSEKVRTRLEELDDLEEVEYEHCHCNTGGRGASLLTIKYDL